MSIEQIDSCIRDCRQCHRTCLDMAVNHCLDLGGEHSQPEHVGLMLACAEMCQAAANIMIIGSAAHRSSCRACADICRQCADNCERIGDMSDCVEACRRCAESCQAMAGSSGA